MSTPSQHVRPGLDLRLITLLIVMALPFLCTGLAAVGLLNPDIRRSMTIVATLIPYVAAALSVAISLAVIVSVLYAAGLAATDIARRWYNRSNVYPNAAGLFPLVRTHGKHIDWFDATPDAVKGIAAWTHAQAANGVRPTAAATRAALYGQPPVPALPAPNVPTLERSNVQTSNAFDIDPARSPHILIVGKTGSGKSTLARHLLARFTRRYPTEVIVCDPDGVNWLEQTSASTTPGIANAVAAVHGEFTRRQTILSDGGEPAWSYLILLVEETETVFERLAFAGDDVEDTARFQLREVARMGRKAGVFLWAITQVAAGDVFDLHVRRNMTLFCGLSEPGVGRMLGVPKEIDLTRLTPGSVFASTTGQVLDFPDAATLTVPLSRLYHEQPVATGAPFHHPQPPVSTLPPPVEGEILPTYIDKGRQPTPAEADLMRTMYTRGASLNAICARCYGYKDTVVLAYVRAAVGYPGR